MTAAWLTSTSSSRASSAECLMSEWSAAAEGRTMAGVIVRMWEVRGHPDRLPELVSWVCDTALPAVEPDPRHAGSEVFSSADRVVVISRWRGDPMPLPDPPAELVARSPHCWDFAPVDR